MDNLTGSPPTAKLTSDRKGAVSGSISGNLTTETSPVVDLVGADTHQEPRTTRETKPFELIRADILMQMPDEPEDGGFASVEVPVQRHSPTAIATFYLELDGLADATKAAILERLRAIGATPSLHEAQKMAKALADSIEGART